MPIKRSFQTYATHPDHELRPSKAKPITILSGKFKGTKLLSPGLATTHPMGSREKLALFNMLTSYLKNAKVLDYFAGSGALGLEALSRGAASATFVENNPRARKVIEENCVRCGIRYFHDSKASEDKPFSAAISPASEKMYIPDDPDGFARRAVPPAVQRMTFLSESGAAEKGFTSLASPSYDIIISDPPYDNYQVPDYASLLRPGGILALSHPKNFDPKTITDLTLLKTSHYAACHISLFTK